MLMSSTNPFRRITIENSFNVAAGSGALVEWDIEKWFVKPGPWVFVLFKSRRHDGDWVEVTSVTDQSWAYDVTASEAGLVLQTYYRVELRAGDGSVISSDPTQAGVHHDAYEWRIMREVVRKTKLIFEKHRGGSRSRGWLLRLPVFGERSANVDPNTGEIIDPNSEIDFGTGYVGGYLPPIPLSIRSNGDRIMTRLTADQGVINGVSSKCTFMAYPKVQAKDVWVDATTDERYYIGGAIATIQAVGSTSILQEGTLERIAAENVVYKVPVPRGS